MADYPEWVMKHKRKGTYVNHKNGTYYLYAAHSERVPGTKKVRRVSDGYIGRITEKDGLIPARDKVSGEVAVLDCGVYAAALSLCARGIAALNREHRGAAGAVAARGLLLWANGAARAEDYAASWLSVALPGADVAKAPTPKQAADAERVARMAADAFRREFGEGEAEAAARLRRIHVAVVNGKRYAAGADAGTMEWMETHKIKLEVRHGECSEADSDVHGHDQGAGLRATGRGHPQKAGAEAAPAVQRRGGAEA